jgi:dCMP deaminase
MKQKFIDYYMKVAELTSTLSYAKRLQVGAVIVNGNKILATGYNGMPSGWDNDCETLEIVEIDEKFVKQLVTKQEVLHAETNAIAKVSSSTESSEGAVIFCTHAPCINCAKLIYQSGINSLYYRNTYRDTAGIEFLEKSGVSVTKYETQG